MKKYVLFVTLMLGTSMAMAEQIYMVVKADSASSRPSAVTSTVVMENDTTTCQMTSLSVRRAAFARAGAVTLADAGIYTIRSAEDSQEIQQKIQSLLSVFASATEKIDLIALSSSSDARIAQASAKLVQYARAFCE